MTHLSKPDLGIVALYLVAITIFGLRFSKSGKQSGAPAKSLKSYFLADNAIPWWAIALSIVSAETSTLTIISIPGVAFAGNLGFLQIVLGYMLGRIVVAFLFLPKYFRGEMLTAYQLIDQRFGSALHKITAGLFLLTRATAEGVRVFAISIVVSIAIGTGDTLSIAIISTLTLLYTFEGGMAAVIWTDVVQMALYVAGTIVAIITLGAHVPGGWSHIAAVAQPLGKFHMLDFTLNLTTTYTFWAGILGGTFLTMASHGTDQLMVQRLLAARNLRESRLALLSSGAVIFLQFTLFLLIGIGLFVFYSAASTHFKTNDYIFPTYIVQQMPHGIAGLLIAAILAAAMSNLSAALNSLASTTVIDFYVPFRSSRMVNHVVIPRERSEPRDPRISSGSPQLFPGNTTLISRLSTIFWAITLFLIALYSIQHGGKGHVVETGLSIASVAYGSLLGVFLLGTLTKYATQTGAIIGMICGFTLNLILWQFPGAVIYGCQARDPTDNLNLQAVNCVTLPHVAFTWYVLIGAVATFAVGTIFSIVLPKRRRRILTAAALVLLLSFPQGICFSSAQAQTPTTYHLPLATTDSPNDFTPVSALIQTAIAEHKLPGAVLLIGHNNQIVFHQAYGQRKLANEPGLDGKPSAAEPMTEDTLFDMASLTKVIVTTTAILQLYEAGKLDLDAPVSKYLPEFAATTGNPIALLSFRSAAEESASRPSPDQSQTPTPPAASQKDQTPALSQPGTQPQLRPYKSQITIRQLLTHYSGLPEDISLKDPWGLAAPDKAEGIRRAMASVPYGPPGQTFKYSDINFITLGYLVETLSGLPLEIYARQNILNPLGMASSGYRAYSRTCGPATFLGAAVYPGPKPIGRIGMACPRDTWSPYALDPNTAPTAHDNELNAAVNPNYDHLLRGTAHDPTTRRMGGVAGHAGLFSTAADMALFCQALLDKLTKNTGPFPLKQSTLQQATSPQAPATAVTTAIIFLPDGKPTTGLAQRGLGWDLNTAFSRPRGEIFPITTKDHPGSFGHTGFTGTSLWLDPTSNTYVILLANAIHPRGNPTISPLRGQVATTAAKALGLATTAQGVPHDHGAEGEVIVGLLSTPPQSSAVVPIGSYAPPSQPAPPDPLFSQKSATTHKIFYALPPSGYRPPTLTGIDVLEQTNFAALKSLTKKKPLNIALLTNQSGLDSHGQRTIDILLHADPSIHLIKIFTPEHGLLVKQDTDHLKAETDHTTNLPVISLYGSKPADRHPKPEDLKDIDAVVIDLQDMGVRFWTYETVLGYFVDATFCTGQRLIVLDRPNPIGGLAVQGNVSEISNYNSYTSLPIRHGLTYGELFHYFGALKPSGMCPLGTNVTTVIPMQNWTRNDFFADTHLPFTHPSPNMKTLAATILYPGIGLIDQTNISVGRGTDTPYENIGATWIDAQELATYLTARKIPGITFTPTTLAIAETPEKYPGHGQTIPGVHFQLTDRDTLDTPELGIEILSALHHLYPTQFQLEKAATLLASPTTLAALKSGQDPRDIAATWQPALQKFRTDTAPYLLYH